MAGVMELSIDTASQLASVALSREGHLVRDVAWRCERNHTVELLPRIEQLLADASVERTDLTAVFVSIGPGTYTGLRVGVSVAQGIARALGIPAIGVGRLELDAYPHREFSGPILAVHRAGRGELAWASYRSAPWRQMSPPRLSPSDEFAATITESTLVVGEVDDKLSTVLTHLGAVVRDLGPEGRARSLATLGFERLRAGEPAEPALLRPIYLRPPAIGPQSPR